MLIRRHILILGDYFYEINAFGIAILSTFNSCIDAYDDYFFRLLMKTLFASIKTNYHNRLICVLSAAMALLFVVFETRIINKLF